MRIRYLKKALSTLECLVIDGLCIVYRGRWFENLVVYRFVRVFRIQSAQYIVLPLFLSNKVMVEQIDQILLLVPYLNIVAIREIS